MAWDVVSMGDGEVLSAVDIRQLQANFDAIADQSSGSPVITFPNSVLNVNAGIGSTGVGSIGSIDVSSSIRVLGTAPATPVANTLYKENIPKAWISFVGASATISNDFNVSGLTRISTGLYTVTWATDFLDERYTVFGEASNNADNGGIMIPSNPGSFKLAGSCRFISVKLNDQAVFDAVASFVFAIGDQ